MAFDVKQWRNERLRLLQRLQENLDTARWLRQQSIRTLRHAAEVMNAVDRERSKRSFQACEPKREEDR